MSEKRKHKPQSAGAGANKWSNFQKGRPATTPSRSKVIRPFSEIAVEKAAQKDRFLVRKRRRSVLLRIFDFSFESVCQSLGVEVLGPGPDLVAMG